MPTFIFKVRMRRSGMAEGTHEERTFRSTDPSSMLSWLESNLGAPFDYTVVEEGA